MTSTLLTPIITIWIHGTFPQDFISKDLYHTAPFDYIVNLYYCPPGLNRVIDLPEKYNYCQLARTAAKANPHLFPLESFYLFGWSGKLNPADRDAAGARLYQEINTLIKEAYHGQQPFIRIITHSHGGNVALAMAKECADQEPAFHVDELIFLGTPVHKATVQCTQSPLFKNIFSVHSHIDMIQVLDPQGWPDIVATLKKVFVNFTLNDIKKTFLAFEKESFFSERHFPLQKNLKNVRLKFNGRDVFHMEYILLKFFATLPTLVKALEDKDDVSKMVLTPQGDWLLDIKTKPNLVE